MIFTLCGDVIFVNDNVVETVTTDSAPTPEQPPHPFQVDVLIHFATEAWESLERSASMRGVDIEAALSTAIGLLEMIETDKKNGIEWCRKIGGDYVPAYIK